MQKYIILSCLLAVVLLSSSPGHAAKIVVVPMFSKSHVYVLDLLSQELTRRGHEVLELKLKREKLQCSSKYSLHMQ